MITIFKKLTLATCAASALFVAGCASYHTSSDGFDASVVTPFIKVNKTTMKDVRAYLGTPTLSAETADGSKVLGYGLAGHNTMKSLGRNLLVGTLAGGIVANKNEYTLKTLLFKFNKQGVVSAYKTDGASFLSKFRITGWNECEHRLTQKEINSPVYYDATEICEIYAKEVAEKEHIAVDKVDTGKEFESCDVACQVTRHATEAFGELKNAETSVNKEDGDGSKIADIFNK